MDGVVGDRGVRGGDLLAGRRCVDRRAREEAALPGATGVDRDRGADVRGGSVLAASHLKGGDHRRPEGEAVRLDRRLVLAVGVRIWVDGDPPGHDFAVRGDDVGSVGADDVEAWPAVDPVLAAERGLDEVVASRCNQAIRLLRAKYQVAARRAVDRRRRCRRGEQEQQEQNRQEAAHGPVTVPAGLRSGSGG